MCIYKKNRKRKTLSSKTLSLKSLILKKNRDWNKYLKKEQSTSHQYLEMDISRKSVISFSVHMCSTFSISFYPFSNKSVLQYLLTFILKTTMNNVCKRAKTRGHYHSIQLKQSTFLNNSCSKLSPSAVNINPTLWLT